MSGPSSVLREARFMVRDRALQGWALVLLGLSVTSVWSGLAEVRRQEQTLELLAEADRQDRAAVLAGQESWGGAAYYSFHLTYEPPSEFAFAAMGQRDQLPWKHRIRMLALEGQIYESDAGNPELALVGRLDHSFLAAFVLPIALIMLLHDSRAGERTAGRHDLLVATVGRASVLWTLRASLRAAAMFLCLTAPLVIGGCSSGARMGTLALASAAVLAYTAFWTLICTWLASWRQPASVILAALLGFWVLLAAILPAGGRTLVDRWLPVPSGADIVLTQREAVNDAWDLPKQVTMDAFLERHPEWSEYATVESPFEWKWYYAFQQVGDQKTEALSSAYRDGRRERDGLSASLALLAPPALLERFLQRLARTDAQSMLRYEDRVRAFHAELRRFYYPKLFEGESFERAELEALPRFGDEGNGP